MSIITAALNESCYKPHDALGRVSSGLEQEVPKRPSKDVLRENITRIIRKFPSQKEAAKAFGVSNATVSRWLNGEREIDYGFLDKIADVEGVHPASLMIDHEDPDGAPIPDLSSALIRIQKIVKNSDA